MMLCSESHVAYEWLNRCCFHGCCGWNIAATVLEGFSRALETRRCAKVNLCENIARTQFRKDSWGDGITDMASCGITMCRWIAGIHPRIGKFPQICRGPEIIEIWVTALKPSQLCKACCHFIKPASLIHSTCWIRMRCSMWSFPWAIQPVVWRKGINYACTCVPRRIRGGCDIHCSRKGKIGCWVTARWGGPTCSQDWWNWKRQPMDWAVFPYMLPVKKPHTRH